MMKKEHVSNKELVFKLLLQSSCSSWQPTGHKLDQLNANFSLLLETIMLLRG